MTGPSPRELDVVSDTICPWCYVGKRHLDAALAILADEDLHFALHWRPFQLNPGMPAGGVDRRTYRIAKFGSWERSQALDAQVAAHGAAAGLAFRHDRMARTPNTVASHVVLRLAREIGGAPLQDRVVEALFTAYFEDGQDVGDPDTLVTIATAAGLDPVATRAALADPARHDAVLVEERRARALHLDGVPSVVLDDRLLFSGAQPVPNIVEALRAATREMSVPLSLS